jgi:uncharacterized membrane protein YhaH (DUF805 family)
VTFLSGLWGLINLVPGLSLLVRRLRDAGFHWAFIFLNLIPLGSIAVLVMLAMPTKEKKEDEQTRLLREIRDLQKEQNEKNN